MNWCKRLVLFYYPPNKMQFIKRSKCKISSSLQQKPFNVYGWLYVCTAVGFFVDAQMYCRHKQCIRHYGRTLARDKPGWTHSLYECKTHFQLSSDEKRVSFFLLQQTQNGLCFGSEIVGRKNVRKMNNARCCGWVFVYIKMRCNEKEFRHE